MYAETYNDIEADGAFGRGLDRETDAFVRLTPAAHSLSLRRRPSIQLSTGLGTVSLYSMQRSQLRGQRTETHRLVILILTFTCITGELLNRLEACCVQAYEVGCTRIGLQTSLECVKCKRVCDRKTYEAFSANQLMLLCVHSTNTAVEIAFNTVCVCFLSLNSWKKRLQDATKELGKTHYGICITIDHSNGMQTLHGY